MSNQPIPKAARQIPDYVAHEFHPKARDYCVAIFVINENGKLHKLLDRMQAHAGMVDIVIADGGSTDGSTDSAILTERGVNTLLVKTGPGKLGAQMRMAFGWALDRGYRGIITIDGNNKDDPTAISEMVNLLEAGFDHIQGSRFLPGGISENLPWSRWLGIKLLHVPLIRWASGFDYTDTTNGFRGYSRRFLEDPRVDVFREVFSGYELHYYLAIRAACLGHRVCETAVSRRYPAHGPVPTKISFVRGNLRVVGCLLKASLGHYNSTRGLENSDRRID